MVASTQQQFSTRSLLCPCGKSDRAEVERISRGVLIKTFLFWLPVKRYKCYRCKKKRIVFSRAYN